jgi:branched-chain amino acid transport system substrate-binding protein
MIAARRREAVGQGEERMDSGSARRRTVFLAAMAAVALLGAAAQAADTIKVGLILTYSGAFADNARQIDDAVKLYMKQHGDTVAGRKIEIVRKDAGGPAPDVAKRLAQELVVREKVDFLAGFVLTPNALAAADISAQAKKPMIIMNAATSIITTKSPYVARVSFTLPQVTAPLAEWAAKNGVKQVYTMVTDYGPGHDAEAAFQKAFKAAGGTIVGEVRMPLRSPEFSAYVQRVKDADPQAVFLFVPSGEQPVQIMKTMAERGVTGSGIKILATGDVTDDGVLQSMGEPALGIITSHHYSYAHDSTLNREYVEAFAAEYGDFRPDFLSVGGYDGMAAIYEVVRRLDGKIDPDRAMAVLKGLKIESPRGPIEIDAETRDVVQTVYIRKVEKRADGKIVNTEFDRIERVKDPGK